MPKLTKDKPNNERRAKQRPTTLTKKIDALPVKRKDAVEKRAVELAAIYDRRQRDLGHK